MSPARQDNPTVLLLTEGSVLAHVGRSLVVGHALKARGIRVRCAASGVHAWRLAELDTEMVPVVTSSREELLVRLKGGGSAFTAGGIQDYVADEMRVLDELAPDLVVGDFRPSLGISAPVAGIPYVCVTNAVWTRYCSFRLDPPDWWLPTRIVGKRVLRALAPVLEGFVFRHYARPFNKVRGRYGLPARRDIRDCMCSDELTLVADSPALFPPASDLPRHVRYVGPLLWEAATDDPEWLGELDADRPVIYLTMGSTGPLEQMRRIARALLTMGLQVVCTTATEEPDMLADEADFHAARYCPGGRLSDLASVVVCHAGNGTIYQALSRGTPIVAVPEFHDQEFNMQRVEAAELGLRARPGAALADEVVAGVRRLLDDPSYTSRARAFADSIAGVDAAQVAADAIEARLCGGTTVDAAGT